MVNHPNRSRAQSKMVRFLRDLAVMSLPDMLNQREMLIELEGEEEDQWSAATLRDMMAVLDATGHLLYGSRCDDAIWGYPADAGCSIVRHETHGDNR